MASVPGRNRHLESALSFVLLAILTVIFITILVRQADFDLARFGTDPVAAGVVDPNAIVQPALSDTPDLTSLAPEGFSPLGKTETYIPNNLYEKINGKAPLYTESGFLTLFTQRFVSRADESLWSELFVYDMTDPRNAFCVYSVQKRADAEPLNTARFAYRTTNAQYFIYGKYYVEILGSTESPDLFAANSLLANNLLASFPSQANAEITEIALFPEENLVTGSPRLYLKDAFGCDKLTETFVCRYTADDEEEVTAFLTKRKDPDQAEQTVRSYQNFIIENGGELATTDHETLKSVEAKLFDFYGTTEIIFAVGPFVAGVHEAETKTAAEQLAARLALALSLTQEEKTK